MLHRAATICASICLLAWSGCAAYRIGANALYPADVHTVFVPVFESDSFRRDLGERLTEAVCKRIEQQTPFKVVASANADSVLTGRLTSTTKAVLVRTHNNDPREDQINFQVQVSWVNRKGDLIRQSQAVAVPAALIQVDQAASLVPEFGQSMATAQQQAIDKLAQQIVELMEQPW